MTDPTIYVPTYGRVGDQRFLNALRAAGSSLLQHITLAVVPSELKGHKKEWYFSRVKKVQVLPPFVDCIAKKRKWFADHCPTEHFYQLDDDVDFRLWVAKTEAYVPIGEYPNKKRLTSFFLEGLPEMLKGNAYASFSTAFMAKPRMKTTGAIQRSTGYYAYLFETAAARKNISFNRMMFYNDSDAYLQLLRKTGLPPIQDLHVIIKKQNTKKFDGTGADVYRTQDLVRDSMLKFTQYHSGVVTGKKQDEKAQSLQVSAVVNYLRTRKWKGFDEIRQHEYRKESLEALKLMMQEFELTSLPPLFEFDDRTPRDEIVAQIQKDYSKAKKQVSKLADLELAMHMTRTPNRKGLFQ